MTSSPGKVAIIKLPRDSRWRTSGRVRGEKKAKEMTRDQVQAAAFRVRGER